MTRVFPGYVQDRRSHWHEPIAQVRLPHQSYPHDALNPSFSYLETGGEGALVKPWAWLIWLALGARLLLPLTTSNYFN